MGGAFFTVVSVGIVIGVVILLFGIFMRMLIPGCAPNFSADASAALSMIAAFALILLLGIITGTSEGVVSDSMGNTFGEAVGKFIPFFKFVSDGNDAITVLKSDVQYFVEELFHLLFLMVGAHLVRELLPTTPARGTSQFGKIFTYMAAELITFGVLSVIYQSIESHETVRTVISVVVSLLTLSLPLPMIFAAITKHANKIFIGTGIVVALMCAFWKVIGSVIIYIVVVSLIGVNLPLLVATVGELFALVMAFGPVIIMLIGLALIVRAGLGIK